MEATGDLTTSNLKEKGKGNVKTNKGTLQEKQKLEKNVQSYAVQVNKSTPKTNMMKSKNIIEKFVKTSGKEQSISSKALKPTSAAIFKSHKTKGMNNQREKTLSLMLVLTLTSFPMTNK